MFPAKLASKKNQFNIGGIYFIKAKTTIKVKIALKLFELKLVLILSSNLFPLNSILIRYNPIVPIIKWSKNSLNLLGKKPVKLRFKNVLTKTSKKPIKTREEPKITKLVKFSLLGLIKIFFHYFSLIAIFLLYQFINTEMDKLKDKICKHCN